MTISLTPHQQDRLAAYVARGHYRSVEEAALALIEEGIANRAFEETNDLLWAKPYVDEALEDVANGETVSHSEHRARIEARLDSLKS